MSVNIILPMWLSIAIGIIITLNLFINMLKLIPKNIWIKILIFLFYKNNIKLYTSKMMSKKAKDSLNAEIYMQNKQKKQIEKRLNTVEKNSKNPPKIS